MIRRTSESSADDLNLSNGRYTVQLTSAGTGQSHRQGLVVNRHLEDPVEDGQGQFLFLRDCDNNEVWSVGLMPCQRQGSDYTVRELPGVHEIRHVFAGIEATLRVTVATADDLESRRLTLANLSGRPRRLEVTSYFEPVLTYQPTDLNHPAFAKLFLQTEYVAEASALLVQRRPRGNSESWPTLFHALVGAVPTGWETDRFRFIGRGKTVATAIGLTGKLSGTTGNVLDPCCSLRTELALSAGEQTALTFLTGFGEQRDDALRVLRSYQDYEKASDSIGERSFSGFGGGLWISGNRTAPLVSDEEFPPPPSPLVPGQGTPLPDDEPLQFFNGFGGFNTSGTEYVIRLKHDGQEHRRPPLPWINVIANQQAGFLVSETGAGCTWSRNSQANRLTPWFNDPITDPHGEAIYLFEAATGAAWSPLPGPMAFQGDAEVRHGFGYSTFRSLVNDIEQIATLFVPRQDPVKITLLTLRNTSAREKELTISTFQQLVLGTLPVRPNPVVTRQHEDRSLRAVNTSGGPFADGIAFTQLTVNGQSPPDLRFTCDRLEFIGRWSTSANPVALQLQTPLSGACGSEYEPCFVQQGTVTLLPGETVTCIVVLGEALSDGAASELIARYGQPEQAQAALEEVRQSWASLLSSLQVETPSPALNVLLNGWMAYQTLACRMWARTAFYQSSGAYGYRDQLQDSGSLLPLDPRFAGEQILLHARHQFQEGDVLHWWHPAPINAGLRTRFSDDLLWLPLVVTDYLHASGDESILSVQEPFLTGPALHAGEDENYLIPQITGGADLYEHCCRTIDRSLPVGAHGLPLMGTGDWNDGMNRVGREGRGESVWVGFFLYHILGRFLPFCEKRNDFERMKIYAEHREHLLHALNDGGWDGEWYRRAYYDNGQPLGSQKSDECRIDALAQAWAIISGAAPPDRAASAMDAMSRELISTEEGLIRLLTPPFVNTPNDPGYIKGYVAGIRENGGQYTHAACWVVKAVAQHGDHNRAAKLLEMLSPIAHTLTPADVHQYKVEPYVIAADIYGAAPHVGRGGWTWYTGSAGWFYRVAIESILGVTIEEGSTLVLTPCIPDDWPAFEMRLQREGLPRCRIRVENPQHCAQTLVAATVNGQSLICTGRTLRVPLPNANSCEILLTLGPE
ncbi:GH36-type glycosyl hydrolase domain-containing protein [Planctomicrobium sp. SH664]|uniref:GH36-type glycosyl hydrolase domain-containing protein n=1 Tax=Planctomicrobium sp. SH664 TaxID=3448125 RepID=UPI003F5B328D